jgi:hypothetical protein
MKAASYIFQLVAFSYLSRSAEEGNFTLFGGDGGDGMGCRERQFGKNSD